MITTDLKFSFKDLFNSPRIALSGKKIFVFIQGNLFGFIVYWICSLLSLSLSGYPIQESLKKYGLYPCLFGNTAEWYSWLVYFLGILIWIYALLLCSTTVSRITLKQLKGNNFYSASDAWCYTRKHWHAVIFSPITILLIILVFLLFAGFFALLSYLPIIGELIYSLLYSFYFLGSFFTLYTFFVLLTSLIYTPIIVGTYEEDTMGTVFQSYSISFGQNWRIIFFHIILIPLILIGTELFSWFCMNSIGLIKFVFEFELFHNSKLININNYAYNIVYSDWLKNSITSFKDYIYDPINFGYSLPNLFSSLSLTPMINSLSLSESFAGIILALSYFFIGLSIISYGLSIFVVGETLMFIIFKKISDDDNVLIRKDEDDIEEDGDSEILDINITQDVENPYDNSKKEAKN